MNFDKSIFSENLRRLAEEQGESQTQIADFLGTTKSTVNAYFLGKKMPRFDKLQNLARHFGVTVDDIIGETKNEYRCLRISVYKDYLAETVVGYEEISVRGADGCFAVRVNKTRSSKFAYGDTVIIRRQRSVDLGQIVFAKNHDEVGLYRVIAVRGMLVLEPITADEFITLDDVEIIGRAVEVRRKL